MQWLDMLHVDDKLVLLGWWGMAAAAAGRHMLGATFCVQTRRFLNALVPLHTNGIMAMPTCSTMVWLLMLRRFAMKPTCTCGPRHETKEQ